MFSNGLLVAIEGLDGSGKTTVSKALVSWFKNKGFNAIYTAEPSNSPIGMLIKEKIIGGEFRKDPRVEALLFAADRLWHLIYEIEPLLSNGVIVITDRYYYSSIAYQGALNANIDWIKTINAYARKPDIAVYIDITPEEALERKRKAGLKRLFENTEYLRKVRQIYLKLVREGELHMINGMKPLDRVVNEVILYVENFLSRMKFS